MYNNFEWKLPSEKGFQSKLFHFSKIIQFICCIILEHDLLLHLGGGLPLIYACWWCVYCFFSNMLRGPGILIAAATIMNHAFCDAVWHHGGVEVVDVDIETRVQRRIKHHRQCQIRFKHHSVVCHHILHGELHDIKIELNHNKSFEMF